MNFLNSDPDPGCYLKFEMTNGSSLDFYSRGSDSVYLTIGSGPFFVVAYHESDPGELSRIRNILAARALCEAFVWDQVEI